MIVLARMMRVVGRVHRIDGHAADRIDRRVGGRRRLALVSGAVVMTVVMAAMRRFHLGTLLIRGWRPSPASSSNWKIKRSFIADIAASCRRTGCSFKPKPSAPQVVAGLKKIVRTQAGIGAASLTALILSGMQPILNGVTRFFLAILLAISMAGASGPAFAGPPAGCEMARIPSGIANHDKMGCCPPECAVPCPTAMLTTASVDLSAIEPGSVPTTERLANMLPTFGPAASDPPPRTTIS